MARRRARRRVAGRRSAASSGRSGAFGGDEPASGDGSAALRRGGGRRRHRPRLRRRLHVLRGRRRRRVRLRRRRPTRPLLRRRQPTPPRCTATRARSEGSCGSPRLPDPATDLTEVVGAYPVDIDGDGRIDLAVLRVGENVLLRGLGDCRFERGNEAWGFDGGDAWTAAFSATWEGSAALPTLAFGNYLDLTTVEERRDLRGQRAGAARRRAAATYAEPIPLTPGWCTLSILFSDWDRSGRRDLRMANDRHYYTRRRGAAVARRRRRAPAPLHPRRGLAAPARSGAWASPATTSPATACPRSS